MTDALRVFVCRQCGQPGKHLNGRFRCDCTAPTASDLRSWNQLQVHYRVAASLYHCARLRLCDEQTIHRLVKSVLGWWHHELWGAGWRGDVAAVALTGEGEFTRHGHKVSFDLGAKIWLKWDCVDPVAQEEYDACVAYLLTSCPTLGSES